MNIIIIGAPGSGKGTQAERLSRRFAIPAISTGEIIRNIIRTDDALASEIKSYINNGLLIPDDIMLDMVERRIKEPDCANGFILDGFPRTLSQADRAAAIGIKIDVALEIELQDDVIVNRLSGRRQCSSCGTVYHIKYNPVKSDCCDVCGGDIIVRADDSPEVIRKRLAVYHEKTEPLRNYYNEKKLLCTVTSREQIEDTAQCVLAALEVFLNGNH